MRNMLATYDELWALGWKSQLERMMVEYFETYESETNKVLDWGYAARMVISSFINSSEQLNPPTMVSSFEGRPGTGEERATAHPSGLGQLHSRSVHPILRGWSPCGAGARRSWLSHHCQSLGMASAQYRIRGRRSGWAMVPPTLRRGRPVLRGGRFQVRRDKRCS